MSLGQRINHLLAKMMLLQEGATVDYTKADEKVSEGKGGHGRHGTTTAPPSWHGRPLVVTWVDRLEAIVKVMERDVAAQGHSGHTVTKPTDKTSSQRQRERKAILEDEVGREPIFVAFLYGWTENNVRRLRREKGLDPVTGEPRDRALTAPASAVLESLNPESTDNTEE